MIRKHNEEEVAYLDLSRKLKQHLTILLAFFMTGCVTLQPNQISIEFKSEPTGALVYESNKAIGSTPLRRIYTLNQQHMSQGYGDIDIYVVWPSGAKVGGKVRLSRTTGQIQNITFSRPSNAPGLDIDLAHVARLRQAAAAEEQASQLSRAASDARAAREAAERASENSESANDRLKNWESCLKYGLCF